ncbi:hypothetical protein EON83_26630 [bacterium]|nr:MAG: hypothetical protein EON83_26630 [bacterium]
MKHSPPLSSVRLPLLLAGCLLCAPLAQAVAQTTKVPVPSSSPQWEKLLAANSRITAAHVVWKRWRHIAPANNDKEADKWEAVVVAAARKRGLSEAEAKKEGKAARQDVAHTAQTLQTQLDFTRVGSSVLCTTDYFDGRNIRTIEFSDGTDDLSIQSTTGAAKKNLDGTLFREVDEVLGHSVKGFQLLRLLTGLPLNERFSESNPIASEKDSTLVTLPGGDVAMQRMLHTEKRGQVEEMLGPDEVVFEKEQLYPVSASSFGIAMNFKNGKMIANRGPRRFHAVASDYKQYPGGIWFPSKITVTNFMGTSDFVLDKAEFNEQVDASKVLLPPNLRVADVRFGTEPINYTIKDGKIPSDEYVKSLLKKK